MKITYYLVIIYFLIRRQIVKEKVSQGRKVVFFLLKQKTVD